jgi:hypothetical protein
LPDFILYFDAFESSILAHFILYHDLFELLFEHI